MKPLKGILFVTLFGALGMPIHSGGAPTQEQMDKLLARPPFDMALARDAGSLEMETVKDWHAVATKPPTLQKHAVITLFQLPSGAKARIPVFFVIPESGKPCRNVLMRTAQYNSVKVELAEYECMLLQHGIGVVRAALESPTKIPGNGKDLVREMNKFYFQTADFRTGNGYLWGMTYMRALTAAYSMPDRFQPGGKVFVTGASKAGFAAAMALINDDRFTAMAGLVCSAARPPANDAWRAAVAKANAQFQIDLAGGKYPAIDEAVKGSEKKKKILAKALEKGPGAVEERAAAGAGSSEFAEPDFADWVKAGWPKEFLDRYAEHVWDHVLVTRNLKPLTERGARYFFHCGSNDNASQGVAVLGRDFPGFPECVVPGGTHGTTPGTDVPTPQLPEAGQNISTFALDCFLGGYPWPDPPRLEWKRDGRAIQVKATFADSKQAGMIKTGALHWAYDRSPVGSAPYYYDRWQSAEMKQTSPGVWAGQFDLAPGKSTLDILTFHHAETNGRPIAVSSPYTHVIVEAFVRKSQ